MPPRLPLLDPAETSESVRDAFSRLPAPLAIFRVAAHADTTFRPLLRLGATILGRQDLPDTLRELAILRVAERSAARYEWVQHAAIARDVGVEQDQIEAVERGADTAPCFDEQESAVLRFTTELIEQVRPTDDALEALRGHLPDKQVVELVIAVGYYMTLARLMETAGLEPEPAVGGAIVETARV